MSIHPSSIIHPSSKIDESVEIGPFCIIGEDVEIKKGSKLLSHVVLKGPTTIGENNTIYQFATIGDDTPDKKYKGEKTKLIVGDNNIFREGVTIHRGTIQDQGITQIGSNNLFMAYTHIAHDCIINNNCILSNAASLAGHVKLESHVSLGGFTLVHQFCQVGEYAFSGLGSVISQDVTPYTLVAGNHAKAYKINAEGLRRNGFTQTQISNLEKCFKLFIKSKKTIAERKEIYDNSNFSDQYTDKFIEFIISSERGITR